MLLFAGGGNAIFQRSATARSVARFSGEESAQGKLGAGAAAVVGR